VFARNSAERRFALELGAVWAGDFDEYAPVPLARVIDTTPAWRPIVASLRNLGPGGTLIVNAIRKEGADQSALLELDYGKDLWMEKSIKSVANVSRADVAEFLDVAAGIPLKPEIEEFDLADANRALVELKRREIRGAKVLLLA
jgi:propanol-preferring alcohol dehydrogenase